MEAYNPFNGKSASNGSGSQGDGAGGVPGAVGAPGGPGGHPGAHPGGHPVGHPGGHSGGHPGGHPNGPIGDGAQGFPTGESARQTLWMGELSPWMDEGFVRSVFTQSLNENVQVKIIRDRHSGNAGYCFVEFNNQEAAQKALQLNGQPIPNTDRLFRLNWASGGGLVDRRDDRSPEYSIFVGDLGHEVNEFVLVALFQARFPSCKSAKIMTDQQTGQSRGYGFVRFSDEQDQQRALVEMQGVYCGNRPMRVSPATPKNRSGGHQAAPPQQFQAYGGHQMVQPQPMQQHGPMGGPMGPVMGGAMGAIVPGGAMGGMGPGSGWMPQPAAYGYQQQGGAAFNPLAMNQFTDPNNTTVFVGGLSGYVTEDELRSFFQGFGDITYVKIPPGKGCGFVQFVHRHAAEMAINQMQGYPIGNSRVRLSWGRSQNNSGVGTPYRPAPPPPHYYPSPGGPAGPPAFGPGSGFGANHQAAHSGGMGALSSQ